MPEALDLKNIAIYNKRATGEKFLINPNKGCYRRTTFWGTGMKKFLMVFGGIALVAVLAVAGMIGWAAYRGSALDNESKAFVDAAVPAIARNWNKQELLDRAAPELRTKATPEQLAMIFDTLAKLGPMVEYEGAKGQATMSYGTDAGANVSGSYDAMARFQNGSAVFHVGLVKRDGRWTILNFHVDPTPAQGATKKI